MENFKDIEGYEGSYKVSDQGTVLSLKDNFGKIRETPLILKWVYIGYGPNDKYPAVNLYKDKKPNQRMVHRLVAEAFIPNELSLPLVNHKDENKNNPKIDNLEWCTHQYNQEYSLSKQVYVFLNPDKKKIEIKNLRKFSRENNMNHAHMYQVHLGRLKSYRKWTKYVENI